MNDAAPSPRADSWQTSPSAHPKAETTGAPQRIGRYRIVKVLGEGGFGKVYLAHDDELNRAVAIKVPHRERISRPEDMKTYLAEARTLASLDHPNIVPVFDVGSTEDGLCYVVSKYIEGSDLAQKIKESRPSHTSSVELVATVSEALHYAHRKGLVHRDIKPANLLLDTSSKPFVADFGLALKEEDFGKGAGFAGTPAYMSPEQARGEGHRVDGRSDIFSLGVVFYQLLTGRRPFAGESVSEVLEQVKKVEARPPRQVDDAIPKELERICLKALAKRASERYTTARDMADDLRHFLAGQSFNQPTGPYAIDSDSLSATPVVPPLAPADGVAAGATPAVGSGSSDNRPLKIVPKGLRSFDAHDADFFLELLPGPRDREGLPDSIRFWKTRMEEADPDNTFAVGLIYGPSGCGKSSLMKAGLLPRLAANVIPIYVEATGEETEARLLKGLRKHCPDLPVQLDLVAALTALRRERFLPPGKKVLLVLDQFEQFLHARKEEQDTELVQALRQCDGGRVQGVVLVRDDFWLAVSRFLRELEIRLVEGQNSALADLFDVDHARKVLAAFGRAFGKLPEKPGKTTREQQEFVTQAIQGLSQEGKVVCVRLALFAEMMKGKAWTPATLKAVGGTEGVGVTFLEETFSTATAPPEHRYHQKAARAVLKALLPESGTDIKGHMRSHAELLEGSGYGSRPRDFADLIRILDSEIRLITPTDPEGKEDDSASQVKAGEKYYQLTHDYLVPSLRDWLTRKQKETRRGRAELLLADRAAVWNARPENRQLPSLLQWSQIRWLTRKKNWTPPQRKMMRKASSYHVVRGWVVALFLALLGWGGYEGHGRLQAHALQGRLLDANTNEVPTIVQDMAPYRRWLDPLLHDAQAQAEKDNNRRKQLHIGLALLSVDATQVEYLYGRLLDAAPGEVPVIRDFLVPHKEQLTDRLWAVVEAPEKGKESQRLRAAAALAKYDPDSDKWAKCGPLVVKDLVLENSVFLGQWSEAFRPVKDSLLAPLVVIFRDQRPERAAERTLATNLLADYAAEQPRTLADLLMDADDKQFTVIYPKFKDQAEGGLPVLTSEIDRKLPPKATEPEKEKLAKRQANAAVALLKMNQPAKVWPLLKHSPDPRARSYLIHRFGPLGADAGAIVRRLAEEPDATIRRALILSLGPEEFAEEAWTTGEKKVLVRQLQEMYRTAADPGLHGAAEWLLRQWHEEPWLARTDEALAKDKEQREKRLEGIKQELTKQKDKTPQWYVNSQGQTMVVVPGPVEFVMGSPVTEAERSNDEQQHRKQISRTFAIAAKAVTLKQFLPYYKQKFSEEYNYFKDRAPTDDCPVHWTTWYMAAAYCNWLSDQEGIRKEQWCYEMDPKGEITKLKENYLSLAGYRLLTEAEWEYACRAGAVTSRYYGETEELLGKYGWYLTNGKDRSWPVGSKKPNDLGLFDMHGNVYTWCQESYDDYPAANENVASEDKEDKVEIKSTDGRVLRGGSFDNRSRLVRCADRKGYGPTSSNDYVGFRPARTFH